jgi:hypothetical protein
MHCSQHYFRQRAQSQLHYSQSHYHSDALFWCYYYLKLETLFRNLQGCIGGLFHCLLRCSISSSCCHSFSYITRLLQLAHVPNDNKDLLSGHPARFAAIGTTIFVIVLYRIGNQFPISDDVNHIRKSFIGALVGRVGVVGVGLMAVSSFSTQILSGFTAVYTPFSSLRYILLTEEYFND